MRSGHPSINPFLDLPSSLNKVRCAKNEFKCIDQERHSIKKISAKIDLRRTAMDVMVTAIHSFFENHEQVRKNISRRLSFQSTQNNLTTMAHLGKHRRNSGLRVCIG